MTEKEIIFIDIKPDFEKEINKIFKDHKFPVKITTKTDSISKYKEKGNAFVSPANSYQKFYGGVDAVYARMFKGLNERIEITSKNICLVDINGDPYIPVGKSKVYKIDDCYLFVIPTMKIPSRLPDTPEVPKMACKLMLKPFMKHDMFSKIYVPGLGTGCGGISYENCAKGIFEAFSEYFSDTKE